MYASIDVLMDKLDRQVQKHKTKLKDHHREQRHGHTRDDVNAWFLIPKH